MAKNPQMMPEGATSSFGARAPRNETNWIGVIRTSEGVEIPCTVKDVSKTGAKIGVPASYSLPDSFMLKVVGKDFVCRVTLAWRKGHFVGVRIEQIGKVAQKRAVAAEHPEAPKITVGTQHKAIGSHRSRISSF